jgi:hypothetical protein
MTAGASPRPSRPPVVISLDDDVSMLNRVIESFLTTSFTEVVPPRLKNGS